VHALRAAASHAATGLWNRAPSTWTSKADVAAKITNRLGWLTSPALMAQSTARMRATAADARRDGFTDAVLLGMGGSSLAPEVLRSVIGVAPDGLRLHMIDSTDPAAVCAITTTPARTLYILASKSGSTIEPNSLAAHFQSALQQAGVTNWAAHFLAITDEGTVLHARALSERFREVFVNPTDIGGRYSALSYFGMVPAALMGQQVDAIVEWGITMLGEAEQPGEPDTNPAVGLGLMMAAAARSGRDKLTLVVPPRLEAFGLWVEQLVAESTGKEGHGVVPIAGEPLGDPTVYGSDRFFVRLRVAGDHDEERRDRAMATLSEAPIVTLDLLEPEALGAEFMRWEIATAICGALFAINPFDEPNVQQAKDATNALLSRYTSEGVLPSATPDRTLDSGTTLTLSRAARTQLENSSPDAFLSTLASGDYLGVLAYLGPDPLLADALARFRHAVRDRAHVATMFGYGPRYLHSTGQLHKGGPNTGVFVVITATPDADLPVPGAAFSFGTLELAQGRGDFASLDATDRRALHLHLSRPDPRLLEHALTLLLAHVPQPSSR
jgi:glucose-6-phosphate isomerase